MFQLHLFAYSRGVSVFIDVETFNIIPDPNGKGKSDQPYKNKLFIILPIAGIESKSLGIHYKLNKLHGHCLI